MSQLRLSTSVIDATAVIELEGELDLAGANALEQELATPEVDSTGAIVLDLRGVNFMDSSGLRVIAVTLLSACTVATLVAMGMPSLLHRLGRDPAFGAGPLATVVQDLLSISVYLILARLLVG